MTRLGGEAAAIVPLTDLRRLRATSGMPQRSSWRTRRSRQRSPGTNGRKRVGPALAGFAISEIIGDAEGRLGVPRRVTKQTMRTALDLDGGMCGYLDEFLDRVRIPATGLPSPAQQ